MTKNKEKDLFDIFEEAETTTQKVFLVIIAFLMLIAITLWDMFVVCLWIFAVLGTVILTIWGAGVLLS